MENQQTNPLSPSSQEMSLIDAGETQVFTMAEIEKEGGMEVRGETTDTASEDETSGHGGVTTPNDPPQDVFKKPTKKPLKKKEEVKFIEKFKDRTDAASRRGESLKKKAEEFQIMTGGKVFLKIEYQGFRRDPYQYCYGEDFALSGGSDEAARFNKTHLDMEPEITPMSPPAFTDDSQPLSPDVANLSMDSSGEDIPSPPPPSPVPGAFGSPTTAKRTPVPLRAKNASGGGCMICSKTSPILEKGGIRIADGFFTCGVTSCKFKVHYDCAGFPANRGVYYCTLHRAAGRVPYEEHDEETPPAAAPPPAATRPRRGRSSMGMEASAATTAPTQEISDATKAGRGSTTKSTRGGGGAGGRGGRGGRGRGK